MMRILPRSMLSSAESCDNANISYVYNHNGALEAEMVGDNLLTLFMFQGYKMTQQQNHQQISSRLSNDLLKMIARNICRYVNA